MPDSIYLLVFRMSCNLARVTDFFKCYYKPMSFYIFNVFKSVTVIIPFVVLFIF